MINEPDDGANKLQKDHDCMSLIIVALQQEQRPTYSTRTEVQTERALQTIPIDTVGAR